MTSDPAPQPPPEAYAAVGPRPDAPGADDTVRRLLALTARSVDMAGARVAFPTGVSQLPLTTPGYDEDLGRAVAGLDAEVAGSGRLLAVPDLAASRLTSSTGIPAAGAYLGIPLLCARSSETGVLHVLDKVPRPLVDRQLDVVASFGRALCDHLDLRAQIHASEIEGAKAADVEQAVRTGRIVPWYQPIIDLRTSKVIGLEALARRIHPDGRIEMPAVFIPIAERSDIIIDLDLVVAGMALRDLRRWQRVDAALTMSVNLSGRHLDQAGWVAVLESLASAADVSPFAVQLEITETAKPSNRALAADQIRLAQALGFSVWLDDFGSGWSGLSDLLHLNPDGIKLDQSFAGALETRPGSVLIRALTTAASTLGVTVVMEGIERPEQAALARELGCDYGQGFLWSGPVPAVGVDRLQN